MTYKVLIPTAGTGSRLGGMTKYINKSLISVGNKPVLAMIIDAFPAETEFVIATGYKGELVKEFLSLAYPDRKITFVDVLLYEGEGSGLGLTVLKCKEYLQEPFIFCACDTIVTEKIPLPDHNWIGYDHREAANRYRKVHMDQNGMITEIDEKEAVYGELSEPYIGLAGIYDWEDFWDAMEQGGDEAISQGESYGLRAMIPKKIEGKKFTWFDIGVTVELEATRRRFQSADSPNILEKDNEAIWFLNNHVIKFSDDSKFISDRVKRSKKLVGFIPPITGNTTHMYRYDFVKGDVLSKCISKPLFESLLEFSKKFWIKRDLNEEEARDFQISCMNFYREKTYKRVEQFYGRFGRKDNANIINEVEYPALEELLKKIDWNYIADGIPGQFHGDYHFENIIYNPDTDDFKFLDWRQSFEKSLDIGDIYYDFAKLNHGMIICHELIAKDMFSVKWEGEKVTYDFARKQSLVECEELFAEWLKGNGYDDKKVRILTALIFLNIAALHEETYAQLLYSLGKKMLYDNLTVTIQKS